MPVDIATLKSGIPHTLFQQQTEDGTTGFFVENISGAVDWTIYRDHHSAIIHLDGAIRTLESHINGKGGQVAGAKPGELWLIPAGNTYHSHAKGNVVNYAVMTFPAEGQGMSPQISRFDPFLLSCVRRMATAMAQADGQPDLLAEQIQIVARMHIASTYAQQPKLTPRRIADDVKFLQNEQARLIDHIDANLDMRLRIADLATFTGRTPYHLVDACRDAFGMTPAKLVTDRRLRHARELLRSSQQTVTSIALATGFSSHAHFIRAFQQTYSMTPTQFRARGISPHDLGD